MRLACVTGGDDRYFLHLLLLIASFRRHCRGRTLYVCDFGLDPRRRAFLERHVRLLPLPADLPAPRHVWDKKAALLRYLAAEPFDAMLWIDTDAMLAADAPGELERIASEGDDALYCCAEALTIAGFIAQQRAKPEGLVEHFAEAAARMGVPGDRPYLNSGFFLCRSREFLAAWERLARALPLHVLFEQNAFNLVAHGTVGFHGLERSAWNCSNADLDRVRRAAGGACVTDRGEPVRVIHCTTNSRNIDVLDTRIDFEGGKSCLTGMLRVPVNPALRALQQELIEFVASELPALKAQGLVEPGPKA
jgi:hypothetical protein